MTNNWTTENIPNLSGKVAIVTGANSGIGYETAKAFAAKGAATVLACRNPEKANTAAENIRTDVPDAKLEIIRLDLADLASVRSFAETFKAKYTRLDFLINNAGVMAPPRTKTVDGFELQFAANHLGHFALTGLLLNEIKAAPGAWVVNVSSNMHRMGVINFDDLNSGKKYSRWAAYGQSKLANMLFSLELTRFFGEQAIDALATAAHPGLTITDLQKDLPSRLFARFFGQNAYMGALPTLYAAIAPKIQSNDYAGPSGGMKGYPVKAGRSQAAKDSTAAKRLWQMSEELTGVKFSV